ncbi:plasmid stabilization protein [Streptomyces sp. NPDC056352]|uniref:plasmid stabilization protein n=1 Tax=unclassified Streptomyces TaxID=2593676 RepID=UPI0035DAF9B6
MPPGSSTNRVRQYEHIKESAQERGVSEERAEEIAARTVHMERARSGESRTASDLFVHDLSSAQRGGSRGPRSGAEGPTRDQLYEEARKKNIKGRSNMTKSQLARAVGR